MDDQTETMRCTWALDDQTETMRFTWALDGLSSLKDDESYSLPFLFADCNWFLRAYMNGGYLCLYLELADSASLPSSWRKEVDYTFTIVNKGLNKSNIVLGWQYEFDTKNQNSCGCNEFVSLTTLLDKNEGFLVDDHLVIVAELYVCPREQTVENTSNESLDDPDISKGGLDDDDYDDSSHVSDDGPGDMKELMRQECQSSEKLSGNDMSKANDTLVDLIDAGFQFDCMKTKFANELSKCNWAIKDLPAFQSDASVISRCECHLTKRNLDVFEKSEKNGAESRNFLNEKETVDVNGFQVLPSQVESVRRIFEKHPEMALEFRGKNQHLRKACMNVLLSLIETLCQSLEELSTEDLVEADIALTYLKNAGFKVDWLEKKLEQVVEKKKEEEFGLAKVKETEEILVKLKQKCAELDALVESHKAELSATRTPLSFDDVLC